MNVFLIVMAKYLDWKFRSTTWITLAIALVGGLCAFFLPASYGNENGPVENMQIIVVAIGMYMTCTARQRRHLFVFASFCLFLMMAREVSFGRALFIFADPQNPNVFPKWKDMEYGWLAHVCIGLYMAWMLVYFVWRKVWKDIWEVLCTCRIPMADLFLAVGGVVAGSIFESTHYFLGEELGELVMYAAAVGILYLYSRNKVSKVQG